MRQSCLLLRHILSYHNLLNLLYIPTHTSWFRTLYPVQLPTHSRHLPRGLPPPLRIFMKTLCPVAETAEVTSSSNSKVFMMQLMSSCQATLSFLISTLRDLNVISCDTVRMWSMWSFTSLGWCRKPLLVSLNSGYKMFVGNSLAHSEYHYLCARSHSYIAVLSFSELSYQA